ncbi:MAG: AmmeMemoRadiSam system protein B [Gammaproteobacteria bacterium]|nr:AmmeMemoRadiSam system protein B [Gammaproteobacteria bacterium]
MEKRIRQPAVAGLFYPGDPDELARTVDLLLDEGRVAAGFRASGIVPKALIVPHAGYIYSGPVAAAAYALLDGATSIRRALLLGPAHRVPVRGLAHPDCDVFLTPLGSVPVDRAALAELADLPQVTASAHAHALEHSLEVQLPFLQRQLEGVAIMPLIVGDADIEDVAEVIERFRADPETLIVISSDLSHYHEYEQARRIDAVTAAEILALNMPLNHEQACGATPVNGLLLVAARHALRARQVDLRNSGDTSGDRGRVVGYGAFAFEEVVQ